MNLSQLYRLVEGGTLQSRPGDDISMEAIQVNFPGAIEALHAQYGQGPFQSHDFTLVDGTLVVNLETAEGEISPWWNQEEGVWVG